MGQRKFSLSTEYDSIRIYRTRNAKALLQLCSQRVFTQYELNQTDNMRIHRYLNNNNKTI